ncbi:MAG: hypothetical protein NT094_03235 [Candidatus Staskawiczbacteria bacterium]|nr:hypothetical protein [Candidatus Staskawiczbacteria bacterium]
MAKKSFLRKKVNKKLAIGLITAEVIIVLIAFFVGIYQGINTNLIKADATPSITVTYPNGGETLIIGNKYTITWTATNMNNVAIVLVDYSSGSADTSRRIVYVPASQGSYTWQAGSNAYGIPTAPGTKYKIRINGVDDKHNWIGPEDYSNGYFTMIDSPTRPSITSVAPTSGSAGITTITLKGKNLITRTLIRFDNVNFIRGVSPDNGATMTFVVPKNVSAGLKAINAMNPATGELSNSVKFTVIPANTITSPKLSDNWVAGTTNNIIWTSSNVPSTTDCTLGYQDPKGNYSVIKEIKNTGSYSWAIPSSITPGVYAIYLSCPPLTQKTDFSYSFNIVAP